MEIVIAKTFLQKLKGLMGKKKVDYGMLFLNTRSIHTFFMRESIDIIGLDKDMIVKEIHEDIRPNKVLFLKESKHTLELPKGKSNSYKIGDKVEI